MPVVKMKIKFSWDSDRRFFSISKNMPFNLKKPRHPLLGPMILHQ